jgi:hypothetical protein
MSDNSYDGSYFNLITAILIICILGVVFMLGHSFACISMKNEAVKNGKAEYYLDSDNDKQWRWKP